jgi:hypothetical protein
MFKPDGAPLHYTVNLTKKTQDAGSRWHDD